jgi:pSer/pThr/pTyr-binding forkhead associated (FHA) protein
VLGRVKGATIELSDASVSRRHARVLRQDDEYVLEDLDSSHGTHVDGVPIVSCLLRDGDIVQVGRSVFGFCRQVQYAPPPSRSGAGT